MGDLGAHRASREKCSSLIELQKQMKRQRTSCTRRQHPDEDEAAYHEISEKLRRELRNRDGQRRGDTHPI